MLGKIRGLRKRNGHKVNGKSTNGHRSTAPETDLEVSPGPRWSLEVRHNSELMGSMRGEDPMALISSFRKYTVLYGDPSEGYEVRLSNNRSDRHAALSYHGGQASWKSFLLELDPELEEATLNPRDVASRTPMMDSNGQPMNADSVFEEVFGLA